MNEAKTISVLVLLLKIVEFGCYAVAVILGLAIHDTTQDAALGFWTTATALVLIVVSGALTRYKVQLDWYGADFDWLEEDHYSFSVAEWEKVPQEIKDYLRNHKST